MAKSKRDEKVAERDEEYEFQLPKFDEKAFIRREVMSAKSSFYALGLGVLAGLVSLGLFLAGLDWRLGWLPILAALAAMRPLLVKAKFPEDVTTPKALVGAYFTIFFTGLAVWILGVNFV